MFDEFVNGIDDIILAIKLGGDLPLEIRRKIVVLQQIISIDDRWEQFPQEVKNKILSIHNIISCKKKGGE